MRKLFILFGILIICDCAGQSINERKQKFPGVKKVIVKSVDHGIFSPEAGYRGEYLLDEKGQPKIENRFKKGKLLAAYEYEFLENGLLSKQTTTFDINDPKRVSVIYYNYELLDGKVLSEVCYTNKDTLYKEDNLKFDEKGLRTVYVRTSGFRHSVYKENNYLTYENGLIKIYRSVNSSDSSERISEYGYDKNGNLIKFDYKQIPEPEMKEVWLHVRGDGNHRRFKYRYDKKGRWTKKIPDSRMEKNIT